MDDPHRELLPDPDQADVRDVLDYLEKHSGPDLPRWVRQADCIDALTLNVWLWWEDRRREYRWMTRGLREGLFLRQLGAPRGIDSRAGVRDRIDRHAALLQFDRPDEKLSRETRRAAAAADAARELEVRWISQHQGDLRAVATELLAAAEHYEVADREWLDELNADLHDDVLSPATMAIFGLAAAEVATAPQVTALADHPQPFKVHRTLRQVERLRSQFADVGSRSGVGV